IRSKFNQKGLKMTFVTLDDRSGRMELRLYDEHLEQLSQPLTTKSVLIVKGTLTWDDFNGGMRIRPLELQHLEAVREASAKSLILTNHANFEITKAQKLIQLIKDYQSDNGKPIYFKYHTEYANVMLELGNSSHLQITDDLLEKLSSQFHELSIKVQY
ncbi:OB-fold nucleic acid binding domain-containing protein, partial [Wohlfahrtiimonas larvae]